MITVFGNYLEHNYASRHERERNLDLSLCLHSSIYGKEVHLVINFDPNWTEHTEKSLSDFPVDSLGTLHCPVTGAVPTVTNDYHKL